MVSSAIFVGVFLSSAADRGNYVFRSKGMRSDDDVDAGLRAWRGREIKGECEEGGRDEIDQLLVVWYNLDASSDCWDCLEI